MKNIVKSLICGAALAVMICPSVQAALVPYSISELNARYPGLANGFNDERLYDAVRLGTAAEFERELHLPPNWNGDQYARAEALRKLTKIRAKYGLLNNFTRDQIVENQAASIVNEFLKEYKLSAHFTQADLIRGNGERRVAREQGMEAPAGAADYAAFAGTQRSNRFIRNWHLSEHWSFEELLAVVGPEKGASLSRQYSIHAGMSHDEIVAALGWQEVKAYAEEKKLPVNFTADEAVQAEGALSLRNVREDFWGAAPLTGEINEEWLIRNARIKASFYLTKDYPGLQGNFDEKQLFDYLIKDADKEMRDCYGFVGPYGEADVAKAAADSLLAETRLEYDLPLHFSQEQLDTAMKARKRYVPIY